MLQTYDGDTTEHIISNIPELSKQFLDEGNGGRVQQAQKDVVGIPKIQNDDKGITWKDAIIHVEERAVLVSNPAARKRSK